MLLTCCFVKDRMTALSTKFQVRPVIISCPRPDSYLTYMTPVTLTTEFSLVGVGAR
jgi:hypothetical protein